MIERLPRRWRGRRLYAGLAVASILSAAALAQKKPQPGIADARAIEVTARPIPAFDPRHPGGARFGKLEFRGGLVLTSPSSAFGGWSGLALDGQGRRLLSISDSGVWLTGELTYDKGRPSGIANARLGPLTGFDGKPLTGFRERDSEGFALVAGTLSKGEGLVSFEGNHRILRYPVSEAGIGPPIEQLALPPAVKRLSMNKSLESVCQLKAGPDAGAIVTLAERYPGPPPDHVGWLGSADGRWRTLSIRSIDDFYLTDCHGLDDGGMLVLERRFRWRDLLDGVRMRLRRFGAEEIAAGGTMAGEILIEASTELQIDNMEGLAAHREADGTLVVTMISDDNFNALLQRTVLLQFAWPQGKTAPPGKTGPAMDGVAAGK